MSALNRAINAVINGADYETGMDAAFELGDLRAYAARMKAERDAWSEEAGRLGLELAKLRAERSER